jgi:aspartate/tyrosine/aromatic aminotransferase
MVTVNQPPTITAQPTVTPSSPNHGQNFTLSVSAAGTPTLTYQWYNAATNAAISGATASTYTTVQAKKGTYSYYVIVKNPCNNTTGLKSNTVNVVVN